MTEIIRKYRLCPHFISDIFDFRDKKTAKEVSFGTSSRLDEFFWPKISGQGH
jgi:hypothetical protein